MAVYLTSGPEELSSSDTCSSGTGSNDQGFLPARRLSVGSAGTPRVDVVCGRGRLRNGTAARPSAFGPRCRC
jgi:hypothetical protein